MSMGTLQSALRAALAGEKSTQQGRQWYSDQLGMDLWKKKRFEILCRDRWKCVECGISDPTIVLDVHHIRYLRGRKPWEYPDKRVCGW